MDEKSPVLHPIITVSWQWRTSFLSLLIWRCPKFTFSTFTPDPNLQNPHLHKLKCTQLRFTHTKIYTVTYWQTQIYTTKIYTKLNPNLQRHKFALCQTVQSAKLGRMQVVLSAATPLNAVLRCGYRGIVFFELTRVHNRIHLI